MSRTEDERREWFEGFAAKRLALTALHEGYTDIEIRRERIRAKILTDGVQNIAPAAAKDARTWAELYRAVYGRELTPVSAAADDPPRQGDHRGRV